MIRLHQRILRYITLIEKIECLRKTCILDGVLDFDEITETLFTTRACACMRKVVNEVMRTSRLRYMSVMNGEMAHAYAGIRQCLRNS